mmetsp:Transcript_3802/g.3713  ORF Transcript_3802/g.3713 Transcript_3802/m.3713 type:complete len:129 (-) Transcript_3802:129-515(-)
MLTFFKLVLTGGTLTLGEHSIDTVIRFNHNVIVLFLEDFVVDHLYHVVIPQKLLQRLHFIHLLEVLIGSFVYGSVYVTCLLLFLGKEGTVELLSLPPFDVFLGLLHAIQEDLLQFRLLLCLSSSFFFE